MPSGMGDRSGLPGIDAIVESYEAQVWWGPREMLRRAANPVIASTTIDVGNIGMTSQLRPGLVMARLDAGSNLWAEYDPTKTDGRERARGVLLRGVSMINPLTGAVSDKKGFILVGGCVKSAELLGLDNLARMQLDPHFVFDDELPGASWQGPWIREITLVNTDSPHTLTADQSGMLFVATGAGANVVNLPAIEPGLVFQFLNAVDQDLTVQSPEGDNILGFNNAAADSVVASTSSQKIGAQFRVRSNTAGTLWYLENLSPGNTLTTAG